VTPDTYRKLAAGGSEERAVLAAYPLFGPTGRTVCGVAALDGFVCTRHAFHDGPHVAHGSPDEAFAWWPNDTEPIGDGTGVR
jgi:hypothetical protein